MPEGLRSLSHAAEVASLTDVVRTVFADLSQHGKRVGPHAAAALALVERWLAGDTISAEALGAAASLAHEDDVPRAAREQDRALGWANTAAGNLAYTARKGRGWKDGRRTTMDAALYALSCLRVAGTRDHAALEALRSAAYERAAAANKPPKAPKRRSPKPVRVTDQLDAAIGAVAGAWLRSLAPVFELTQRVDDAALGAALRARGYPDHVAVRAFDHRYGGLVFADERVASQGQAAADPCWIVGAHACISSGAHEPPRGGSAWGGDAALVPVVYSPNDVVYFVDGRGVAWCADTIEGGLERFAMDGDRLVARVLLFHAFDAASAKAGEGAVVERDGQRGDELAAALGVSLIPEASDELARVWGDAGALVFETCDAAGRWTTRASADDAARRAVLGGPTRRGRVRAARRRAR